MRVVPGPHSSAGAPHRLGNELTWRRDGSEGCLLLASNGRAPDQSLANSKHRERTHLLDQRKKLRLFRQRLGGREWHSKPDRWIRLVVPNGLQLPCTELSDDSNCLELGRRESCGKWISAWGRITQEIGLRCAMWWCERARSFAISAARAAACVETASISDAA